MTVTNPTPTGGSSANMASGGARPVLPSEPFSPSRCGLFIGPRGFFFSREKAEVNHPPEVPNAGSPLSGFHAVNALSAARHRVSPFPGVPRALCRRGRTNVRTPVVELVSVDVVRDVVAGQQQSVKPLAPAASISGGVEAPRLGRHPAVIRLVNQRESAVPERNPAGSRNRFRLRMARVVAATAPTRLLPTREKMPPVDGLLDAAVTSREPVPERPGPMREPQHKELPESLACEVTHRGRQNRRPAAE